MKKDGVGMYEGVDAVVQEGEGVEGCWLAVAWWT